MTSQTLALTIATSMWANNFTEARHVYTAVICPILTYGSTVWHHPADARGRSKSADNKLSLVQNRCLRGVAGNNMRPPRGLMNSKRTFHRYRCISINCRRRRARGNSWKSSASLFRQGMEQDLEEISRMLF